MSEQLSARSPSRQWRIDHAGKIDKATFKVLIWFFAALGVVACIVRVILRIRTQKRLFYDDFLILTATCFLVAETGVLYHYIDRVYLLEAAKSNPPILPTIAELGTLTYSTAWLNAYNSLGWAAVFSIKASFLVVFYPLVRSLSGGILTYFWCGTALTVVSWIMITCEPFILCPYFGLESFRCGVIEDYPLYLGLSLMVFLLDIATDVIIISIPLILLRIARMMRLAQKIRIATFLCLSSFMVIISLVRVSGGLYTNTRGQREFSFAWAHMLLHIEASVGVLMGTISAFRSVFRSPRTSSEEDRSDIQSSFLAKLFEMLGLRKAAKSVRTRTSESAGTPGRLSRDPQADVTLFSLKRYIRRHGRQPGHTTLESIDDPQEHYHEFVREDAGRVREGAGGEVQPPENVDAIELVRYPPATRSSA